MEGILYGVGVGPGDPELMTLQAVRVIRECDLILAPGKEPRETVAWQIAAGAVPELEEKEAVGIHMPMTKDPDTLKKAHGEAAERIIQELAKGRRAAFLTLGDPCIYSTYLYVHKKVRSAGCRAEIIFITSHFECMAEGYEVDALHYLVKPVPAEKLRAVLDRAAARLAVEPPSVVIACEEGNVKLYESELLYAESFLHDLVLHTTGPDYRIRESISAFAGRLSADFFRTHRSYLVNLKAVVRIGRTSVLLRGGAEVPLARGKYDAINRAFIDRN